MSFPEKPCDNGLGSHSSRGSSQTRNWTLVSCTGRQILYPLRHQGSLKPCELWMFLGSSRKKRRVTGRVFNYPSFYSLNFIFLTWIQIINYFITYSCYLLFTWFQMWPRCFKLHFPKTVLIYGHVLYSFTNNLKTFTVLYRKDTVSE